MLDQYVSGQVTRISPEAPVPVVKVSKEWSTLGGAANVAANVSSLGGEAFLVGLVGNDDNRASIEVICKQQNITHHLFASDQPTITKTRIVSGQQIVRVDREELLTWNPDAQKEFASAVNDWVKGADLILLSDYDKGTLSDDTLSLIFRAAEKHNKRVLIDPKRADWQGYAGAFAVTPNLAELAITKIGKEISNEDNLVVQTANLLRSEFSIKNVVATRSSYGMTLVGDQEVLNIPTRALEVYDVSGAGDTVLAALGVRLAEGHSISESAFFANAAAGIVVSKLGTATVTKNEVESSRNAGSRFLENAQIDAFKKNYQGMKVVFTNGCFDVLHQGHRSLLEQAKELGDVLVVAINSDESITRLKGSDRPINTETGRIEAISALPYVDKVLVFSEDTPYQLLEKLNPDVLVKGGDYKPEGIVGADLVDEVIIIDLVEGISTSNFFS